MSGREYSGGPVRVKVNRPSDGSVDDRLNFGSASGIETTDRLQRPPELRASIDSVATHNAAVFPRNSWQNDSPPAARRGFCRTSAHRLRLYWASRNTRPHPPGRRTPSCKDKEFVAMLVLSRKAGER